MSANAHEPAAAADKRLEVVDRFPRSPVGRHALVGRKLQSIYAPPSALPDHFRLLLEQLDGVWSESDAGTA